MATARRAVLLGALLVLQQSDAQESALSLFQQALSLEREGCELHYPSSQVNGGGHRRMQMGLGELTSATCDLKSVQDRAAEVDMNCCPNDECGGSIPSQCDYRCATHFLPFFADCGPLLAAIGQDMSAVESLCTPSSTSRIRKLVAKADCPNAILSCHHGEACVDGNGAGGGATPAELADCTSWSSLGGGWTASGEPCGGIASITGAENLVMNPSFESPALSAVDCTGNYDNEVDGHCMYKYVYQRTSDSCTRDCTVDSWQFGESDDIGSRNVWGSGWVIIAENGNEPWGSLDSHMGSQYAVLQGAGTYMFQQLRGLQRGSVYEVRLRMANRPGYSDDESVVIKVDNHVIGESSHPSDDFSEFGVAFTARSNNPVLRIENDSPSAEDSDTCNEDCSVFIDEVSVTPIQLGAAVSVANADFDQDAVADPEAGFTYMTPSGWLGSGGNVLVQSGNGAWGGVTSAGGANFIGLQGMGSYVEQSLQGLTPGTTYVVAFSFGDRPGFGEDELMHVKADGLV